MCIIGVMTWLNLEVRGMVVGGQGVRGRRNSTEKENGMVPSGSIKEMEFECVKLWSFWQGSQRLDVVYLGTRVLS